MRATNNTHRKPPPESWPEHFPTFRPDLWPKLAKPVRDPSGVNRPRNYHPTPRLTFPSLKSQGISLVPKTRTLVWHLFTFVNHQRRQREGQNEGQDISVFARCSSGWNWYRELTHASRHVKLWKIVEFCRRGPFRGGFGLYSCSCRIVTWLVDLG